VAVVSSESYENRFAQGFSDTLRNVPGVLAQKRFGEESRLSIRGSGIAQSFHQRGVLFAQDGVPFADADGFSDFQGIDALSARYIEVYK
ncbi:Plug domain-containing protein, partial [Enterococcus faecium]